MERAGASLRRPLHVVLQSAGGGPLNLGGAPAKKVITPLALLWSFFCSCLFLMGLSYAWLVGSHAYRIVAGSGVLAPGAVAAVSSPAASNSPGAAAASSSE